MRAYLISSKDLYIKEQSVNNQRQVKGEFLQRNRYYLTCLGLLLLTCLGLFIQNLRFLRRAHKKSLDATSQGPRQEGMDAVSTRAASSNMLQASNSITDAGSQSSPVRVLQPPQHSSNEKALLGNIKRFLRIEKPYPIAVSGIACYILWKRERLPSGRDYTFSKDFQSRSISLGAWAAIHIFQLPLPGSQNAPWLKDQDAMKVIEKLLELLKVISATESSRPAYIIFHVQAVRTRQPLLYRFYSEKRKNANDRYALDVQEAFVERLQTLIGTNLKSVNNDWEPNGFEHYDRNLQRRGWLTIAPAWALIAGVDAEEARVLADLIQPRNTSSEYGGILSRCYEEVLQRVAQWNGTQDIFEAVNQLKEVVEGSKKSTNGQVWLNFALASIGVLLALSTIVQVGAGLIVPVVLFAGASMLHAGYANTGQRSFQILGLLLFTAAVIAAIALFSPLSIFLLHPK